MSISNNGRQENAKMVKSELVENIAKRSDITLPKAEEVIDLFLANITKTLNKGGRVEIRGFGSFTVKEYKSYEGRNPKTGKAVLVHSKRLPVWRTGTELRMRVDSKF